ncbi:hypothetical protein B0H11DRAFT_392346 [Mycena galericulata]|nr:hypothetical protein B0H11DRAFT_392346 [Mycena galericulata]
MSNNVHVASPVHGGGEVRCFRHGVAIQRQVSQTSSNFNRAFYSCNIPEGPDGETCSFFKWEDDLALATPPSSAADVSSTRKRSASTTEHELSPAPKRPSTSQRTTPRTPASQARLDAILRAQGHLPADSTMASASTAPRRSASPSPSSSRRVDTPLTDRTAPTSIPAQPSTPLYRPMTPPPTAESAESRWPPQTPPSSRVPASTIQSENGGGTRDANFSGIQNGIQNQSFLGTLVRDGPVSNTVSHWPTLNRKYVGCQEPRLDADPFGSPSGSFTGSGGSESEPRAAVAYNSRVSADSIQMSPAVREFVDFSNRSAAYITQLELRLSAAEKSNDAKARKMEQLLEEIERLKVRNAELEHNLQSN